jgi:diadenosine tetraphosphate (Ap4A) HIT family hydrolase
MTSDAVREERSNTRDRALELIARGICPACHDLEHDEPYGRGERVIYEDDRFLVLLERHPRMLGHTIIVYKPHRDDFSDLSIEEGRDVMAMCVRVAQALKQSLAAEKVYLVTMCDGPNHLHLQLLPRYAGEDIGSTRLVLPRAEIDDAAAIATQIRAAFSNA